MFISSLFELRRLASLTSRQVRAERRFSRGLLVEQRRFATHEFRQLVYHSVSPVDRHIIHIALLNAPDARHLISTPIGLYWGA